jgi:uncharacterized membrane protein (DUF2068 family)
MSCIVVIVYIVIKLISHRGLWLPKHRTSAIREIATIALVPLTGIGGFQCPASFLSFKEIE